MLCVLMLTSCASSQPRGAPLIDHVGAGNVRGDAEQVSVEGGRVDALPLAVFHCAHYHRSAQFVHTDGKRSVFNCVSASGS